MQGAEPLAGVWGVPNFPLSSGWLGGEKETLQQPYWVDTVPCYQVFFMLCLSGMNVLEKLRCQEKSIGNPSSNF
jgi:hypothetical protein